MEKSIKDVLAEELRNQRRGFDHWLKNTGKDDKIMVTLLKIPLGGKSANNGGIDNGNEGKETSEGS